MLPMKLVFDKVGNTLNVWFDDPQKEHVSAETTEDVILVKDSDGRVIGVEVLNYLSADDLKDIAELPVERHPEIQAESAFDNASSIAACSPGSRLVALLRPAFRA